MNRMASAVKGFFHKVYGQKPCLRNNVPRQLGCVSVKFKHSPPNGSNPSSSAPIVCDTPYSSPSSSGPLCESLRLPPPADASSMDPVIRPSAPRYSRLSPKAAAHSSDAAIKLSSTPPPIPPMPSTRTRHRLAQHPLPWRSLSIHQRVPTQQTRPGHHHFPRRRHRRHRASQWTLHGALTAVTARDSNEKHSGSSTSSKCNCKSLSQNNLARPSHKLTI